MRPLTLLLAVPAGLVAVAGTWLVLGLRREIPFFRDGIRRMNRAVMNPMQVRNGAGGPGAWASVIHHVGRTSGRAYATPIGTGVTDDGFVVALPYGPGADWVRNVLAAGEAVLDDDGRRLHVTDPRVVTFEEVAADMPPGDARSARLFGVRHALVLRRGREEPRVDAA